MVQNVGDTVIRFSLGGGPATAGAAPELPVGGTFISNMEYPTMLAMEFWAETDCNMNIVLYEGR